MEKQIAKTETAVALPQGNTPADMIRMAVSGGADLDKLEKLLTLQERYEANEAKKAYVQAMALFKTNPPKITKDKKNSQYNSMYTTLGNLINTVNPELCKQGLSASWDIEQGDKIKVTCKMTHRFGHSESASVAAPADTSGSKNVIQQIKSTITYLKAVTFESITGLASTDANCDDDGTAAGVSVIDEKQVAIIQEYIIATESNEAQFCNYMKIDSIEAMPATAYQKALNLFKTKVERKKK